MTRILCVDFGSTYTKAALVDVDSGALVATASHSTTIGTDLMDALDVLRARLAERTGERPTWEVRACSSAGGGLRVAVVGNEQLVTSEAGHRVALSSGGRVVAVVSGTLDATVVTELRAARPDVVLLVGGTNGGNTRVLRANAQALAATGDATPVVVAGNASCQAEVAAVFEQAGTPCVVADNVLPEIGVVCPGPARAAIREMFVRHVIGGKHLSRQEEFVRIVRGATPDLVLRGVEVLAGTQQGAGVAVVDVGGATTDVHSVVELDPEDANLRREVVSTLPASRTVEGDLGVRWNAAGIVEAAVKEGLLAGGEEPALRSAARPRIAEPGLDAGSPGEQSLDQRLAILAVKVALRRHSGRAQVVVSSGNRLVERTGKDLREVTLLVGSGGVLRHAKPREAHTLLAAALDGHGAGAWLLPEGPRLVVDRAYVLAAVGLLADDYPEVAVALAIQLEHLGDTHVPA